MSTLETPHETRYKLLLETKAKIFEYKRTVEVTLPKLIEDMRDVEITSDIATISLRTYIFNQAESKVDWTTVTHTLLAGASFQKFISNIAADIVLSVNKIEHLFTDISSLADEDAIYNRYILVQEGIIPVLNKFEIIQTIYKLYRKVLNLE